MCAAINRLSRIVRSAASSFKSAASRARTLPRPRFPLVVRQFWKESQETFFLVFDLKEDYGRRNAVNFYLVFYAALYYFYVREPLRKWRSNFFKTPGIP